MANPIGRVLQRTLQKLRTPGFQDGAELLERYVARRDEVAFAEIVRRHGPMVWQVCRRMLAHTQDAEDAFQATFIVLTRKAQTVDNLGGWLHGVAHRVALEARTRRARHEARQKGLLEEPVGANFKPEGEQDWRSMLDEEIARLPVKYRLPVILCCLEEKTIEEAARHLNVSASTVKRRVLQARERLHNRLARRGVTLSAAALVAALSQEVGAAVPAALRASAVQASASAVSPQVATLAETVLKATLRSKTQRLVAVILLSLGLAGGLAGWMARAVPTGSGLAASSQEMTGQGQWTWKAHDGQVRGFAISPQTRLLLTTAERDTGVKVWRLPDSNAGEVVAATQLVLDHPIHSLGLSVDGRTVAIRLVDETIELWDLSSLTRKQKFAAPNKRSIKNALVFSPDGKWLATGNDEAGATVYETATGKLQVKVVPPVPYSELSSSLSLQIGFTPDSQNVFVGLRSRQSMYCWNLATGQETARLRRTFPADLLKLTGDGRTAILAFADGREVVTWDLQTEARRTLSNCKNRVKDAVISHDAKAALLVLEDQTLILVDRTAGREQIVPRLPGSINVVAALSDNGLWLARGTQQGTCHLWKIK